MADNIINAKIREAHDTEANWIQSNPILLKGQLAYSSDKYGYYKVGDGSQTWEDLSYVKAVDTISKKDHTLVLKDTEDNIISHVDLLQDDVQPLVSKTYTGIVAAANNQAEGTFYFATVLPDSYSTMWHVRFRTYCYVPGQTLYQGSYISDIWGKESTYIVQKNWNSIWHTSYRPMYYHTVYFAKSAGITNGYGHALGECLWYQKDPTASGYARTFNIDILEADHCTVEMFEQMLTYAHIPGTGSTNYNGIGNLDACNNGLQESGDANTYDRIIMSNNTLFAGANGIYGQQIVMRDESGTTWSSVTTAYKVSTDHTRNPIGFHPEKLYWYSSGTTINSGGKTGTSTCYEAYVYIDFRYSSNCGTTLTPGHSVYLKGYINNGLFYLDDTTWWTQTLPSSDDGNVYIYVGEAISSYQVSFPTYHPIYWYKNGKVCEYNEEARHALTATDASRVNNHTVDADVPSNAKFTDTTYTAATAAPGKISTNSSVGTSTNYARQDHTHGIDLATGDSNGQVKIAGTNISVKGLAALAYKDSLAKADVGLGNVDNKSSETIRSEITSGNVTSALGYTPVNKAGDTMSSTLTISKAGETGVAVENTSKSHKVELLVGSSGNGGIYDRTKTKWVVYSDTSGNVTLNGNANTATTATTATNVSTTAGSVNSARHIWFSDSAYETRRNHDDDFTYNPNTNVLTVGQVNGSATLTGTPTAPTAALGTNTTQIATTEFVNNQISDLKVSGRNLLKDSHKAVSTGDYLTATYYLGNDAPVEGEIVTLQVKGQLASTKSYWQPYNSGAGKHIPGLKIMPADYNADTGIYTVTGAWSINGAANTYLNFYAMTSSQAGVSQIEWVKLERGYKATDWSPAPEDVVTSLSVNGKTVTYKNYAGTSLGTITTQDTTYTAATAAPGKVATSSSTGTSTNYARQDHTHGIDLATGDANGQVKIAGTNVSVKGLGALAYKESLGKADVGLGNVDNTSDANKPISTATQTALNGKQATITGGATTITSSDLTASRALVSNSSGKVAVSDVTSTELGYLDGVTSAIQTQLDDKSPKTGSTSITTLSDTVTFGNTGFHVVTSTVTGAKNKAVGWYRIAQIGSYSAGIICFQGGYNSGWPTNAVIAFSTSHLVASMRQLAGRLKNIFTKLRIVRTSDGKYYIDAYQSSTYTTSTSMSSQYFTIIGNATITALNPTDPTDDTTDPLVECDIVDMGNGFGYLPLSGGTLTGTLTAKGNVYTDSYTGALNMNNSNIYGVNSIYTCDASDNAAEGIHFYRDATHVDTLWMNGGDILFVPNRALGTSTTKANSQKVGRFTSNPTTGQVVITDGTTGGIISSGYTIAKSVPSDAVFTDTTDLTQMTGTLGVSHGGTGATTFTSGELLIGNGTSAIGTRAIKNITTKGNLGWTAAATDIYIPTVNTLAYWDGRYNSSSSNLTYCVKGAFGNLAIKDSLGKADVGLGNVDNKSSATIRGEITSSNVTTALGYTPVNKAGDTMTGTLTVPIIQTGTDDTSYFQTRKFRGQGDAGSYQHAIDFGYASHNQFDFYEYGGVFNFHKHTGTAIDAGDTLIGTINSNGWNGGAVLTGAPTAPTATAGTNTTQIATTAFVKTAVDNIINGAPEAYDTLKEISDYISSHNTEYEALLAITSDKQDKITGAATSITQSNLTANRALISDSSGKVAVSGVTSTELGYLSGVTSSIQTQLNGKSQTQHNHDTVYLKLAGGTLTGGLTFPANKYKYDNTFGIDMKNSDIVGVNSIYTTDLSDDAREGIHFYRDSTHYDTLWVKNGDILFTPNRTITTSTSAADSQKVARFIENPTNNKLVVSSGTSGGLNVIEYIGGRNYLLSTKDLSSPWKSESGGTITFDSNVGMYKVEFAAKSSSRWGIYQDVNIEPNTQYTFSCVVLKQAKIGCGMAFYDGAPNSWPQSDVQITTEGKQVIHITKTSGETSAKARIYLHVYPTADDKYGYFYLPKLEKQIISTDWSPNPDDYERVVTGGAQTITSSDLTASRALVSNSSGKVAVSDVTSTELGYLDGVTSAIQTQLNGKQASITGGATTITSSNLTASRALISNSSGKVAVSDVTSTELGYLDGVTSAIQTQLNGKQAQLGYTPVDKAGDTMTGNLVVPKTRIANTYYGVSFGRTTSTPKETLFHTGIKWVSGAHMPVIHITGYAYGLQSPVEFKIGFYIYAGNIGYCGAVNMGQWNPEIYLFKRTVNETEYVSVAFVGQCYFLQLSADVQDEMGKFGRIDLTDSLWSWEFLTTTGNVPAADSGVTCIKVPYKADILNPPKVNGHTVASNVPANAVFTDTTALSQMTGTLSVGHGGTGATSFTSGELLIGNGSNAIGTRSIKNITTKGNLGWTSSTTDVYIPTINTLAYWNGRFNATAQNLTYCVKGEFGDLAVKNSLGKSDVGLGNVDNTSDVNKPISSATQSALDGKQATITGAATSITQSNLTASRALVSDSSGKVAASNVSSTELGYLSGVTSSIQTQLDAKQQTLDYTPVNKAGDTMTGTLIVDGGSTTARIWSGINSSAVSHTIGADSNSGNIYLYATGNANGDGDRGLYTNAHGTGSATDIIKVDTNNNVTFFGSLSGAAQSNVLKTGDTMSGDLRVDNRIWAGADSKEVETDVGARSKSGGIYLYQVGNADGNGNRGIWITSHGTGSGTSVIEVDTNNNTTFRGNLNGGASKVYSTLVNQNNGTANGGCIHFDTSFSNSASGYYNLRHNNSLGFWYRGGKDSSADGYAILQIGNATSHVASNGTRGYIRLYGRGANYTHISTEANGANQGVTFPNCSGTVYTTGNLQFVLSGTTLTITTS